MKMETYLKIDNLNVFKFNIEAKDFWLNFPWHLEFPTRDLVSVLVLKFASYCVQTALSLMDDNNHEEDLIIASLIPS